MNVRNPTTLKRAAGKKIIKFMNITSHCGGFCETNGYLIETEEGAVVIDAPKGMFRFCEQKGIIPTGLLLTHQHFDHVEDAFAFNSAKIPVYASEPYRPDLQLGDILEKWGLQVSVEKFQVDEVLDPTATGLDLAGLTFEFRSVPGHSPDSFVFHVALFQKLFSGDTLFANGGLGRTDFPHGDGALLLRSIREQILSLPEDTVVLPGHGPPTTIGREVSINPYLG